jgi:hypothetical protein
MKTSDSIKELAGALSKAQGQFTNPERNREVTVATKAGSSYTFSYATLDAILDMVRKPLADNGLSISQGVHIEDGLLKVDTRLMHESGEWIEETLPLVIDDPAPQKLGSLISYGRRYALCPLLGVFPDEDDDANSASGNQITKRVERQPQRTTATTNGNGQSEQFAKFTDWIKENIPELFSDRNDAWARVKLAASQQKHNETTLRACTDPKVFDAIKSILSVTEPVAA